MKMMMELPTVSWSAAYSPSSRIGILVGRFGDSFGYTLKRDIDRCPPLPPYASVPSPRAPMGEMRSLDMQGKFKGKVEARFLHGPFLAMRLLNSLEKSWQ